MDSLFLIGDFLIAYILETLSEMFLDMALFLV